MKTIEIISIPVANQETAKNFYVDKVGFKIVFEAATPQGNWIQLALQDDNTSISLVSGYPHAQAGSIKGNIISTNDIDKDVKDLRAKGVILSDIQNFPHEKISTFSDPDGNQWVLRETPKY
ncbi:MAG: VOC family protein [Bacteroidetes bacterium]|uniref:VOC family protein n=1 Tax=Flavobacterium filum TaxID=370974 RepID=UPI0023F3CD65|nr:VOC family protein [Flavobacterium filum]MCA0429147.1 VOC family protein [Bacteroidota bacterium]